MVNQGEMINWAVFSVKCCNPLQETGHSKSGKLRKVTEWMCSLGLENVEAGMKICDRCRLKQFAKRYEPNKNDCDYVDPESSLKYLKKSLELVGESLIKKKKAYSRFVHKTKRRKMKNLNELYEMFKAEYPIHQIGFSRFCELRPQNCSLCVHNSS
ncbi:hypothetical protein PR048_030907 [Dryococelus australis]|uniref:Uncharacterized protein n=1 Tax=Dryococelus australis TaxID=614101 RepID=A0ABQ9GA76_9NEOP|nr:hypothetical protein PR048_030907 [Dryococelus australis]